MSIIFFLLLLSSCTSSVLSADVNDRSALLKIKEQLGNPDAFSTWVEGFDFCSDSANTWAANIECTSTSRVRNLGIHNIIAPTAPFPQAICDLTELEALSFDLLYNLYGPIPSCINQLSNLENFFIYRTGLSDSLPEFLNNKKLTNLILSRSDFSGSIPPSLSAIPTLNYLELSMNSLTGTIPPDLVHGSGATLILNNNKLTGEISQCYRWVNFSVIDLGNNQLSGDPSFLFSKEKTTIDIDLSHNDFEFDLSNVEIPEAITRLDLSYNKIYGKVPQSIASAKQLSYLDLKYNNLCGEIPQVEGRLWQPYDIFIFSGNPYLCGNPFPPCSALPSPAPVFAPPSDSTP